MRYILIASNNLLSIDTINGLVINDDDVIILFNYIKLYFKFEKLQKVKRKFVMLRQRSKITNDFSHAYAGIDVVSKISNNFERIFIHNTPDMCDSYTWKVFCENSLKYYGLEESKKLWKINVKELKNQYKLNHIQKGLSSGLIMYLYLKKYKSPKDSIVLVGFTSSIASKFHDPISEKNFLKQELIEGHCEMI
jgi:hypothetical protein